MVASEVAVAIRETGPGDSSDWEALWRFARRLAAIRGFPVGEGATAALRWAKEHRRGQSEVKRAWGAFGVVTHPLVWEAAQAKARLIGTPEPALGLKVDAQSLARLCKVLQEYDEPSPFFLSSRNAGKFLGKSHVHAAALFKALLRDGIIAIATDIHGKPMKGTWETGSEMSGRATRYEYIAERTAAVLVDGYIL